MNKSIRRLILLLILLLILCSGLSLCSIMYIKLVGSWRVKLSNHQHHYLHCQYLLKSIKQCTAPNTWLHWLNHVLQYSMCMCTIQQHLSLCHLLTVWSWVCAEWERPLHRWVVSYIYYPVDCSVPVWKAVFVTPTLTLPRLLLPSPPTDQDECTQFPSVCPSDRPVCTNTYGSYKCRARKRCNQGFEPSDDGSACVGKWIRVIPSFMTWCRHELTSQKTEDLWD